MLFQELKTLHFKALFEMFSFFPEHFLRLCQASSLKARGDFLSAAWPGVMFALRRDVLFKSSGLGSGAGTAAGSLLALFTARGWELLLPSPKERHLF